MSEITKCPICGSPAEVFATGTSECYGYAWQTYGVRCTSTADPYCDMEVSVNADFGFIDMHDDTAIELWNKVVCLKQS